MDGLLFVVSGACLTRLLSSAGVRSIVVQT